MSCIYGITFLVLLVIVSYSMGFGVNLKKWNGWAQVLSGFLLGFLMGSSAPNSTVSGGIILGIFTATMTIWLGPIAWKRRIQAADDFAIARDRFWNGMRRKYNCPRCGSALPRFRIPTSVPQLMYGGWTCKKCGCEVDSTGREITSP